LDFANTKQLDPRITFSRASTANYYDGKTATKAEENLLTYSEQFDNGAWTSSALTITANATTAPDGTTTADLSVPSASSSNGHSTYRAVTFINTPYSISIYAKASGYQYFMLNIYDGAHKTTIYDLSNGVVTQTAAGGTATISYVGNGWYRCVLTITPTASSGYIYFASSNGPTYTYGTTTWSGNGTSGAYIWGAQLEQRSTVAAYTATTSSAITNYIPTLQSAASGVARFDSNPTTGESLGLLIEESRTNLMTASGQLETWTFVNTTGSGTALIAPDGNKTGFVFKSTSGSNQQRLEKSATVSSGTVVTFSIYVKQGNNQYVAIGDRNETNEPWAVFDFSAGTMSKGAYATSTSVTAVGDGWYRISMTYTKGFSNTSTQIAFISSATAPSSTPTFTGTGYETIYVWGAQLEAGSSATSYVATPLTFTSRASSATYLGPNGYITSASTNVARNQTNSVGTTNLLLEGAASNLFQYTDDFANSSWTKDFSSVSVNAIQAPDGSMMADKVIATSAYGNVNQTATTTATLLTASIYAKQGSFSRIELILTNSTGSFANYTAALFDLASGTYISQRSGGTGYSISSYSITDVGSGWYRCVITATVPTAATQGFAAGLSSTAVSGSNIYVWGAQLETGSTATSYIPSVETFSGRSSSGTYYNSSGVLATATSGTSRTTYNPALLGAGGKLLLEPAATNLALQSETFDNATWNKVNSSVTANSVVAPDGNTTADSLVSTSGVNNNRVYQSISFSAGVYTFTVYAKAANRPYVAFGWAGPTTWFNLNSGTIGTSSAGTAAIQSVGNGWYRCSVTQTVTAGTDQFRIYSALTDGSVADNGDGTVGIYLWGAQCEAGSGPTSYIATTTASVTRAADTSTSAAQSRSADVYSASTVTRAADAASMTGTNFSSWFRQGEGTFYVDYTLTNLTTAFSIGADDGTANNLIWPVYNSNSAAIVVNGTSVSLPTTIPSSGQNLRAALAYKVNDVAAIRSDGSIRTSSSTLIPTVTQFNFAGQSSLNGTIKKVSFYPQRLTNTNIQALTS
jgi:hypothetical protein